jgi:hypothetical protein
VTAIEASADLLDFSQADRAHVVLLAPLLVFNIGGFIDLATFVLPLLGFAQLPIRSTLVLGLLSY